MTSPIAKRDEEICQRYLTEVISAKKLGIEFNVSEARVRQILAKHGVKESDRKIAPQPTNTVGEVSKALSPIHRKIGLRLMLFRTYTKQLDRTELAERLGWAVQKVALVERGEFNLTIFDLQDIAGATNSTLTAILAGTEADNKSPENNASN